MKRSKTNQTQPGEPEMKTQAAAEKENIEFTGAKIIGHKKIPIGQIIPTQAPSIRTDPKNAEIIDLANNIRAIGLLVPVIVTDNTLDYSLIAGHRRLAASRLAGLAEMDAIIVKATDEQAELIAITENLKRENLTPLEEAAAIKKLLDTGMDRKTAAAVLGWPESKVARRARLLELIPEFAKAVADNDEFEDWGPAHLELVARFDPGIQRMMFKEMESRWVPNDIRQLEQFVAKYLHLLSKAPWKLDDASLDPKMGACTTCSFRSSHHPGLFDDDLEEKKVAADDRCLNVGCWNLKVEAYAKRTIEEATAGDKNILMISSNHDRDDVPEGAISANQYRDWGVKKGTPGAVKALVIDGPEAGQFKYVVTTGSAAKAAARPKDEKGKPKPASIKERLARHQGRWNAHIIRAITTILDDKKSPDNYPNGLKDEAFPEVINRLASLIAIFGVSIHKHFEFEETNSWAKYDKLITLPEADPQAFIKRLWLIIAPELSTDLGFDTTDSATKNIPTAKRICEIMGIDFYSLSAKAQSEIPLPKAWANQVTPEMLGGTRGDKKPEKKQAAKKAKFEPPAVKVKRSPETEAIKKAKTQVKRKTVLKSGKKSK